MAFPYAHSKDLVYFFLQNHNVTYVLTLFFYYKGSKVTITNLQDCVTQDDIVELFGDIGALRRAKVNID